MRNMVWFDLFGKKTCVVFSYHNGRTVWLVYIGGVLDPTWELDTRGKRKAFRDAVKAENGYAHEASILLGRWLEWELLENEEEEALRCECGTVLNQQGECTTCNV